MVLKYTKFYWKNLGRFLNLTSSFGIVSIKFCEAIILKSFYLHEKLKILSKSLFFIQSIARITSDIGKGDSNCRGRGAVCILFCDQVDALYVPPPLLDPDKFVLESSFTELQVDSLAAGRGALAGTSPFSGPPGISEAGADGRHGWLWVHEIRPKCGGPAGIYTFLGASPYIFTPKQVHFFIKSIIC